MEKDQKDAKRKREKVKTEARDSKGLENATRCECVEVRTAITDRTREVGYFRPDRQTPHVRKLAIKPRLRTRHGKHRQGVNHAIGSPEVVLVYDDETELGPSWHFSYSNAIVDNTTHSTCVGSCTARGQCACLKAQKQWTSNWGVKGFAYSPKKHLKTFDHPVFECNSRCRCSPGCRNKNRNGECYVFDIDFWYLQGAHNSTAGEVDNGMTRAPEGDHYSVDCKDTGNILKPLVRPKLRQPKQGNQAKQVLIPC
ncbi:uncharacterized protein SCHCODRAFT_02520093 [Schizophyllum commune H4-8]|uniref:Pre-SET domain-containing protein n=1 Tax=Schizophyllum commune (strain H4-8 / FGSC 9210) TaxID=578458 RepID=D8QI28_SCHCM|nr:uncharacterized protein SCHCODRAFT_01175707 [Schizophyllum commune H4-8]XP_050197209.1 uncharacterized protein SCHCODRAFT_02520093 [Schizophyllum commune H4-8]KAI5885493.1 hypothetical protein SCHCODRAFT_02520093 [Schizophyllum commune H4-8]KAI5885834.1 hypothetical protein SCHCODRAFT_01175707 [Schizophyllum commune H4-8]